MKQGRIRLAVLALMGTFWFCASASAATNVKDVSVGEVEFVIIPNLTLEVTSDLIQTGSVEPGTSKDSTHADVIVTTNNSTGYVLNAVVGNTTYDTRSLVLGNNVDFFESIDYGTPLTALESGTWGVSFDNGDSYIGLPLYTDENNVTIVSQSDIATRDTTPFLFGASAKIDQSFGNYYNVITFTAVANPNPNVVSKVRYMQQIDSDTVDTMEVNQQYVFYDQRDGKHYFVAKLPDGTVWMTQNLDFEIPEEGITLLPATSDVTESRTITSPELIPDHQLNYSDYWKNYYYRFGDLYFVSGGEPNNKELGDTNEFTSVDDPRWHYSMGSIYSWNVMTAGGQAAEPVSDRSIATESICPKGWRLPLVDEFQNSYAAAYDTTDRMYLTMTQYRDMHVDQAMIDNNFTNSSAIYGTAGAYYTQGQQGEVAGFLGPSTSYMYYSRYNLIQMKPVRCMLRQD